MFLFLNLLLTFFKNYFIVLYKPSPNLKTGALGSHNEWPPVREAIHPRAFKRGVIVL